MELISKAILVLDMPESCGDCPLQTEYDTLRCVVNNEIVTMDARPDWCPLKPVPEKVDIPYLTIWDAGWNACIDEILKGSERD